MPCIYADFTQEPSLALVFTSCPNKAHPDLNSCHLDSAEEGKNKGLGFRALAYLGSWAACNVVSGRYCQVISVIKSGGGHTLCCFVYFAAWELSPVLVAPFFPLICFVLSLLEIWFVICWCKKQKISMQRAFREGIHFSRRWTTVSYWHLQQWDVVQV